MTKRKLICKKLILLIAFSALLLCAVGCGNSADNEEPLTAENSVAVAEGEKLIVDCVGRTVAVPNSPQRIAALDSFSAEAMIMIGCGEQLKAAPNGVKTDLLLCEIYPELTSVSVPMSGGSINAETLLSLQPDLVFLKESIYNTANEVEKLDKLGIKYLVVKYDNMEQQQQALQMIGDVMGGKGQEQATAINAYYKDVVSRAEAIAETIPKKEKVKVYHSINELVRTDGPDSLGYDWISCVGAVDVSAEEELQADGVDYYCSPEQLFVWDPDVIICNEAETVDYLYEDGKWNGLYAVQNKCVYNIPVGATRWGQRGSLETFFAVLWLGVTVYPEYYADVDLRQEVYDFYKKYLNLELDDETYAKMLLGYGIRNGSAAAGN